jgi:hypothetical protein
MIAMDTGFIAVKCIIKENKEGGVHIKGSDRPSATLSEEAIEFLEKFPLKAEFHECDITDNSKNGMVIDEVWKGPIVLSETSITHN